ncbi:hypothetical protein [Glacieibacterium frigidum]|uniref:Uncharacterized protein n=1 Tax=Glacieibacterium frigidum TaxID=2593303 RepID=A0A552UFW6_9SPHN|nr:hypothetical protein [Glacieibacterium frigidum]TRW17113.1 hypothetical protein FMM06_02615 [Glacieibacterium frigidum]
MIRLIRPCLILSALLGFAAPVALLIYDIAVGVGSDGRAIGGLIALSLGLAFLFAVLAGVLALLAVRRRGE